MSRILRLNQLSRRQKPLHLHSRQIQLIINRIVLTGLTGEITTYITDISMREITRERIPIIIIDKTKTKIDVGNSLTFVADRAEDKDIGDVVGVGVTG